MREARLVVAPFEDAFMEKFRAFAATVKTFVKENKWYSTSNKYYIVAHTAYFYINNFDFLWEKDTVYFSYEPYEEELEFTFAEIENPELYLERDFAAWAAERAITDAEFKKLRAAELRRELEELEG